MCPGDTLWGVGDRVGGRAMPNAIGALHAGRREGEMRSARREPSWISACATPHPADPDHGRPKDARLTTGRAGARAPVSSTRSAEGGPELAMTIPPDRDALYVARTLNRDILITKCLTRRQGPRARCPP